MAQEAAYSPGLEGVIAGESEISRIDVKRNRLIIRGYDLVDFTEGGAAYEEVAYLLLFGALPTRAELDDFTQQLGSERQIPDPVMDILRQAPATAHPMSLLRTAVSALSFHDPDVEDNSHNANVRKAVRLLAKVPTMIMSGHRFAVGEEPVSPKDGLGHAANLLYMMRGSDPADYEVAAMNVSLILYAEHGYNASAFAARVTASTMSDMHAAITTGIGTLAG